jgi:hypothetical protein
MAFIPESGRACTSTLDSFFKRLEWNAMRAEQVLPDNVDQIGLHGVTIRKGTVAAFMANARVWSDPQASASTRAEAETDMADALPVLRALGFFDVFEIRDVSLRAWVLAR